MLELTEKNNKTLHEFGKKVSDKMTDLTHQAHYHKVIVHNKHEEPLIKFPLLLGIIVTLILPIFAGLILISLLITDHNLIVEREER